MKNFALDIYVRVTSIKRAPSIVREPSRQYFERNFYGMYFRTALESTFKPYRALSSSVSKYRVAFNSTKDETVTSSIDPNSICTNSDRDALRIFSVIVRTNDDFASRDTRNEANFLFERRTPSRLRKCYDATEHVFVQLSSVELVGYDAVKEKKNRNVLRRYS